MEVVHKRYGELSKQEKKELFDFNTRNCTLPVGVALEDPQPEHGFVGIWDNVPTRQGKARKLVAVGIYRPLRKGESFLPEVPADTPKIHISSLDVDEEHRGKGYGSKLLGEIVKRIAKENSGRALIRMYPEKRLAKAMKRIGFKKWKMFHYLPISP